MFRLSVLSCGIAFQSEAEKPTHGAALHERADDDDDRAGNVPLAGFPAPNGAPALDLDETRQTLGAEPEGVAGGLQFAWGHC